jgi:hypothetical protein
MVDYWKEYAWPNICRELHDDDFECDWRRAATQMTQ